MTDRKVQLFTSSGENTIELLFKNKRYYIRAYTCSTRCFNVCNKNNYEVYQIGNHKFKFNKPTQEWIDLKKPKRRVDRVPHIVDQTLLNRLRPSYLYLESRHVYYMLLLLKDKLGQDILGHIFSQYTACNSISLQLIRNIQIQNKKS